jgi:dipeptidase E
VRLYLSSFRLGTEPEYLVRLAGADARVAVIANAIDDEPAVIRLQKVSDEIRALQRLGLRPEELDLRQFFGAAPDAALRALSLYDALWVRGGNVFVLRAALSVSRADAVICALLADDRVVYAGYSAGPCVLAPTLEGLEQVDDPDGPMRAYGVPTDMSGLGVLDRRVVPHAEAASPGHEATALARLADQFDAEGIAYLRLRDGEALVVDGDRSALVGRPVPLEELLYGEA